MTNLTAVASWDNVPQIELTTPLLGGPGGPLNLPQQALLNRTNFLYDLAYYGIANARDTKFAGGAKGDGTTNDTAAIQAAIDYCESLGGGPVYIPRGVYKCRGLILKNRVSLLGQGALSTKLRFLKSGDNAADAISYVLLWQGAYNLVDGLTIDGQDPSAGTYANAVGNGVYITPDVSLGYHRSMTRCVVQWFAGYNAAAVKTTAGTGYGINADFLASDVVSGSNTLLTGGNTVRVSSGTAASELVIDHCVFGYCDGIAFDQGTANDNKFSDLYIANAMYMGWRSAHNAKNAQYNNIKVYLSRRLNLRTSGAVVPFTSGSTDGLAAVVLTGAGHQANNFEAQENGSHGFALGSTTYSLSNSTLKLYADGNGGYVTSVTANDKRYGVVGVNYYGLELDVLASNFKARLDLAAQSRSFHVPSSKPTFTDINNVVIDNYYKISNPGTTLTVTAIQQSLTTTSNAQDFVFQASHSSGLATGTGATVGDGELSAVNGYSNIRITQSNQTDVLEGAGVGYNVDSDTLSAITVNAKSVGSGNGVVHKRLTSTQTIAASVTLTDINDLQFKLAPGEYINFKFSVMYRGPAAADIRFGFVVPSGAGIGFTPSGNIRLNGGLTVTVQPVTFSAASTIAYGSDPSNSHIAEFVGYVTTGTTGGDFKMQFRQDVSDVGNTQVLSGSFAEIRRV